MPKGRGPQAYRNRRKPSDRFLEIVNTCGFAFLLLLLVYANGNDIYRFFLK